MFHQHGSAPMHVMAGGAPPTSGNFVPTPAARFGHSPSSSNEEPHTQGEWGTRTEEHTQDQPAINEQSLMGPEVSRVYQALQSLQRGDRPLINMLLDPRTTAKTAAAASEDATSAAAQAAVQTAAVTTAAQTAAADEALRRVDAASVRIVATLDQATTAAAATMRTTAEEQTDHTAAMATMETRLTDVLGGLVQTAASAAKEAAESASEARQAAKMFVKVRATVEKVHTWFASIGADGPAPTADDNLTQRTQQQLLTQQTQQQMLQMWEDSLATHRAQVKTMLQNHKTEVKQCIAFALQEGGLTPPGIVDSAASAPAELVTKLYGDGDAHTEDACSQAGDNTSPQTRAPSASPTDSPAPSSESGEPADGSEAPGGDKDPAPEAGADADSQSATRGGGDATAPALDAPASPINDPELGKRTDAGGRSSATGAATEAGSSADGAPTDPASRADSPFTFAAQKGDDTRPSWAAQSGAGTDDDDDDDRREGREYTDWEWAQWEEEHPKPADQNQRPAEEPEQVGTAAKTATYPPPPPNAPPDNGHVTGLIHPGPRPGRSSSLNKQEEGRSPQARGTETAGEPQIRPSNNAGSIHGSTDGEGQDATSQSKPPTTRPPPPPPSHRTPPPPQAPEGDPDERLKQRQADQQMIRNTITTKFGGAPKKDTKVILEGALNDYRCRGFAHNSDDQRLADRSAILEQMNNTRIGRGWKTPEWTKVEPASPPAKAQAAKAKRSARKSDIAQPAAAAASASSSDPPAAPEKGAAAPALSGPPNTQAALNKGAAAPAPAAPSGPPAAPEKEAAAPEAETETTKRIRTHEETLAAIRFELVASFNGRGSDGQAESLIVTAQADFKKKTDKLIQEYCLTFDGFLERLENARDQVVQVAKHQLHLSTTSPAWSTKAGYSPPHAAPKKGAADGASGSTAKGRKG